MASIRQADGDAQGDSALTPRELVAVKFARALTTRPGAVTDAEYDSLKQEFGEVGAQELLIQTCNFAFMNRFTDGLMLPSEEKPSACIRKSTARCYAAASANGVQLSDASAIGALFLSERDHRIDAGGAQRWEHAGTEADGREHEGGREQ